MDGFWQRAVRVRELLSNSGDYVGKTVRVQGWVRTRRDSKAGVSFIELNDGSSLKNLQIVADQRHAGYGPMLGRITTGCSLVVEGLIAPSPGREQPVEMQADRIDLLGPANPQTYPLQKKRHSFEFLREIGHLRPRTNTIGAVARLRNRLSFAVHQFFQDRGFFYVHTPIITSSDCEGAGEVFRVTSLGPGDWREAPAEEPFRNDFFGRATFLTVSGQLQAEIYALALGRVYTFGPTFRSENSNTSRHLAEFWMIEPEMAFCDLMGDLRLAEELVQYLVRTALTDCPEEMEFFARFLDPSLPKTLEKVVAAPFEVVTYTEAIRLLQESGEPFAFPVDWGNDLQAEHERYLTERVFQKPVAVIDFPRSLKPFYMRVNDDEKTVAAMDVLVPGVGEIVGGSQREERPDLLLEQMRLKGISVEDYRWYVELREFGTVPHAGFGLGLERVVQFVTGLPNIREVIPFPRTPGHAEF